MAYMIVRKNTSTAEGAKKKEEINQSSIKGEPGTGYEGPDGGEFECKNCTHFDEETVSCGQKDMMAKSKRPRIENGRVVVHPEGCCEYVDRKGEEEDDDKD